MAFVDKTLKCKDCGAEFVFTASEQEFFAEKGFMNDPGRCPECRRARKNTQSGGFGGNRSFGERQMFKAICADCGKETEVPFQPKEDRPVYCRECYANRRPRY